MKPNRPSNFYLILILGSLTALSPFSIDMYLPAFQQIATDFGVQVSDVSLSLSSYFIGLAGGQLIYGPLLDRYGRKNPLYVGLGIYILASLGCMVSQSLPQLITFRFIQAVGGCAAQVASIAMVRDFFAGKESAKIFSLLILILGASPLLAPTSGAYVAATWGWHSVFLILAIMASVLMAIVYFFLPEGHEPDPSHSLKLNQIFKTYYSILREPQFYTYVFAGALAFSGLFVYLAASPILFLEVFKVSPDIYGWIFGGIAAGFIGCSQLNILFMKKYKSSQILLCGMICLASFAAIFMIGAANDWYGLVGTTVILFLYLSCAGIINPNSSALAMEPFTKNAGSASALMGAIQMTIGAVASAGVGLISSKEVFPFTIIFVLTAMVALGILFFGQRRMNYSRGRTSNSST